MSSIPQYPGTIRIYIYILWIRCVCCDFLKRVWRYWRSSFYDWPDPIPRYQIRLGMRSAATVSRQDWGYAGRRRRLNVSWQYEKSVRSAVGVTTSKKSWVLFACMCVCVCCVFVLCFVWCISPSTVSWDENVLRCVPSTLDHCQRTSMIFSSCWIMLLLKHVAGWSTRSNVVKSSTLVSSSKLSRAMTLSCFRSWNQGLQPGQHSWQAHGTTRHDVGLIFLKWHVQLLYCKKNDKRVQNP